MTEAVTFEQAKAFLEDATRNWSGLLKLNRGDISDTAQALARFTAEALRARDEKIAELENLAKANNDLARIEVAYRKQLAFQRAEMANALEAALGELYAPEASCSCHISPPCSDCVEYSSIRSTQDLIRAALEARND